MDIKEQYEELTQKLSEIIPFTAFPTRELSQLLRQKGHPITLHTELTVENVYNSGDITGILCMIKQKDESEALGCALTHLVISSKNPLYREIIDYQKKRVKRLKKLNGY